MYKARKFKPIAKGGPWAHVTVNPDGSVIVTETAEEGGKSKPMGGNPPPTITHFEALVWSGKWEELPVP